MSDPNRVRLVVGALVLVAGLGASSGCGSDDKTGVTPGAGPSAGSTSGSSSSPGTDATDSPGSGESLPAGFPTDDVPLLHEKVLTGSTGGPDGEFQWSVVLQSARAVEDVAAEVRKQFSDAGYTSGATNDLADLSVLHFTGPKYDVGVTAARSEGHVIITYVVRNAS